MEYSPTAWEQGMRMQDVILRAISGEIHWFQAAEILQMTPRNLRRWRERYERWGYNGLVDKRRCPSKRRIPLAQLERVLQLYRERYTGFNGRHFHEVVRRDHGITLSYSYVKQALQRSGLRLCAAARCRSQRHLLSRRRAGGRAGQHGRGRRAATADYPSAWASHVRGHHAAARRTARLHGGAQYPAARRRAATQRWPPHPQSWPRPLALTEGPVRQPL
jgi:transposase